MAKAAKKRKKELAEKARIKEVKDWADERRNVLSNEYKKIERESDKAIKDISQKTRENIKNIEKETAKKIEAIKSADVGEIVEVPSVKLPEFNYEKAPAIKVPTMNDIRAEGRRFDKNITQPALNNIKAEGRKFDRNVTQPALNDIKAEGRRFDENYIQPYIVDPINGLLNADIIVYDLKTLGSFTLNLSTGKYWMRVDLPQGVSLNSKHLEQMAKGSIPFPDINHIESATQGAISNENGYKNFHSQYNDANTYVSSKRFVDWFSLETVADEALKAYITGGSNAKSTMEMIKEYFLLEWNDLYTWLESQGMQYADEVALSIFQSVLSGESPTLDFSGLNLTVEPKQVDYRYTLKVDAAPKLREILNQLGVRFNTERVLSTSPHLGFVVKLHHKKPNTSVARQQLNEIQRMISGQPEAYNPQIRRWVNDLDKMLYSQSGVDKAVIQQRLQEIDQFTSGRFGAIPLPVKEKLNELRMINYGYSGFDDSMIKNQLANLDRKTSGSPKTVEYLLQRLLGTGNYPTVNMLFQYGFTSGSYDRVIWDWLVGLYGFDSSTIGNAVYNDFTVDLLQTRIRNQLEEFFGQLAFGNNSRATVKKLQLDLISYNLTCEIEFRNKHSWGSINDISNGIRRATGKSINIQRFFGL